ncbi:MAG: hypothetical protein COY53_02020 [Elusimicrobia bacterium CG_4_10_14_0_8_um_filter_37_32]|nr:MAG: hypothetical protein COS17_07635 [Elusimicrobia bacterium CG02_land_8_20_14_3_00_37_13]PIZ13991.1 MAG: hypothetical protein COY53_02020 [Elusimicrobia bacterium CG_4_10_14_0_8_um_filter_37_32]
MGKISLEISIEPKILSWARQSIGLSRDTVAKKLRTSENSVIAWESGDRKTTLTTLKKLSNIYKRSLATFFLPEPPQEPPIPKDFRSLPSKEKKILSSKTLLAIRNARRYQSLSIELERSLNRKTVHKIKNVSVAEDPENLANKLRQKLGISIQTQINWKNEYMAFYQWKEILEQTGIFIFQFSMPTEEIRAFSILEGDIPVIALSSKDSITARIFSLFHEYAHIMLNLSGLCNMQEPEDSEENKQIEIFCNHFAGSFLVPKDNLLNQPFQKKEIDEILLELSKKYKVSKEVVLRRMLICKLVDNKFYEKKREEWRAKEWQPKKGGGINKPEKKCLQEKGKNYVTLVIEAHKQKKITYKDMADYLSLRTKYIPKVEQLIG